MNTKQLCRLSIALAALACGCLLAPMVASAASSAGGDAHVALTPDELTWTAAPPVLPAGVMIAVLHGNPFAEGFSVVRLKIPAHTTFAPHWHPTAESFTVLQGTLHLGTGDRVDRAKATRLPPMSFTSLPALHHHYVYTDDEPVLIDLSFYGPFQIHYVDPADDPSRHAMMKH